MPLDGSGIKPTLKADPAAMAQLRELFPFVAEHQLESTLEAASNDIAQAVAMLCSADMISMQSIEKPGASPTAVNGSRGIHSPTTSVSPNSSQPSSVFGASAEYQLLSSLFPSLSVSALEEAYSNAGNNMETAVDQLLAADSESSDDSASGLSGSESCADSASSKPYDDASSTSSSMTRSSRSTTGSRGAEETTHPRGSSQPPRYAESMEALTAMFPSHTHKTITSALKTHYGDVDRATTSLAKLMLDETGASQTCDDGSDSALAVLVDVFPNHNVDILKRTLRRTGGVDAAVVALSGGPDKETKAAWSGKGSLFVDTEDGDVAGTPRKSGKKGNGSWNTKTSLGENKIWTLSMTGASVASSPRFSGPPAVESPKPGLLSPQTPTNKHATTWQDPKELRQMAHEVRDSRNELFRRAATAFRKGNLTGKGSAAYYSDEGRILTAQIARWNEQAAKSIIERNNARFPHDPNTIDLHELTVREAVAYALEAVNAWHARPNTSSSRPLKIIAGAGTHSSDGVRKVYPAVVRALRAKGWKVSEEGAGWFLVRDR
ncbi:uncharacterized protein EV422DRAFT_527165 [Fimicolochytrium jonesii]|uniref:uncharacterized protein n=1 Tax=Fimicolochytrium jonesii TaxID=1396493 RepID=UPI0022FEA6F4|nr:uncharacterized protein EV422DRAFT_527165 [Fimicolochytrium jonesii]KAI8821827.1 hypothetical protein EV422DRAFT_527165 [Fimicolochytrium jonesii]